MSALLLARIADRAREDAAAYGKLMHHGETVAPCAVRPPLLPLGTVRDSAFRKHYVATFCAALLAAEGAEHLLSAAQEARR